MKRSPLSASFTGNEPDLFVYSSNMEHPEKQRSANGFEHIGDVAKRVLEQAQKAQKQCQNR